MREIKFRGKRIDNDEWIYGMLVKSNFSSHITIMVNTMFVDGVQQEEIQCLAPAVIPESVGQFTGLFDKNGKEIFYKDIILSYYSDGTECKQLIRWVDAEAAFVAEKEDKDGFWLAHEIWDYCKVTQDWITKSEKEIIGNAIDNPEFMTNFTK